MPNEITVSGSLSAKKGGVSVSSAFGPAKLTLAGDDYIEYTQTVATTPGSALSIGSSGTAGWAMIRNMDETNFVTIRDGSSGDDVIKLKAGEFCLFRLATSTPHAVADTAACRVHCLIVED
jgi:hypothetical protein